LGRKGQRESGGFDVPELGAVPEVSVGLKIFFIADIEGSSLCVDRYLASFLARNKM
jgi:hypothetical protein